MTNGRIPCALQKVNRKWMNAENLPVNHQGKFAGIRISPYSVPWLILHFFVILFDPDFFDPVVYRDRSPQKMLVKSRILTGEFQTLIAKIHSPGFMTVPDLAAHKQPALFLPAPPALNRCQVIQQYFKGGIFFKSRLIEQLAKSLGINPEIAKPVFQGYAALPDGSL